jgi:putative acetyltransferase
MIVRDEEPADYDTVHTLNRSAFETEVEAGLVDALRQQADPIVSLVAVDGATVVGHIMLSPVSLSDHPNLVIMGLAPMAVLNEHQNKGVGSALVRAGLERCRELGAGAVVVLGHASYYPRFGFMPSTQFGIRSEYDVPDDVFMVLELLPGYLTDAAGTITYHAAFNNL